MISALIIFAIAAVLSAFFSGYETAFVSANPIRLRYKAEEEGSKRALQLLRLKERPQIMLTSILLGTNISNVTATIAVAAAFTEALQSEVQSDLATLFLVTPLILIFGEIVPKSVCRTHPTRIALYLLPLMRGIQIVMIPVAYPLAFITRLMGAGNNDEESVSAVMSTVDDVRGLVDESAAHGTIDPEEREMIHSVIDLQETNAKEIMVPRVDVQALPRTATRDELLEKFSSTGRSRIPIFNETIDEIIGIVGVRDLMIDTEPENPDIERFIHEARHVPDTMKVDDLLNDMKSTKSHIAIVTDEYGGTFGLITLEDILEEIFGEIQDEHDREEQTISVVGDKAYVVDGRMPLDEAAEFMGVSIVDEEVDSVAGWAMRIAGRIPGPGEILEHGPYRITIVEGSPSQITKLRVDVLENPGSSDVE